MIRELGFIVLTLSFLLALYGTIAAGLSNRRPEGPLLDSARNAVIGVFLALSTAVAALVSALLRSDFSWAYVADVTSQASSTFLRITALWGGQAGSILFWSWLLALFVLLVVCLNLQRDRTLMPVVIVVALGTTAFFIGLSLFITNPFNRLWLEPQATQLTAAVFQPPAASPYIPEDGQGLNPLLRHFGMIGHPPTTYLGFTGFVIPFAYAMAALYLKQADQSVWIQRIRSWTLIAWLFLSVGLILGGRWAYDVLGWGGFWGWDPVENAMLMPWLTGTAFLHSVMIQEKRNMLRIWNMILIILTYSLVVFGTFITRTGVVSSVHSFAKSAMGPAFFIFIALTFLGSAILLFRRLPSLRAAEEVDSFLSREAAFLLQNVLFLAIAFAVFWGTIFPMISELFTDTKITVGPPYFQQVTGPLFAALVMLMAVAPLLAWRRHSGWKLIKSLAAPLIASIAIGGIWVWTHRDHPGGFFGLWLVAFVVVAIANEFIRGVAARHQRMGENPFAALLRLIGRNRRRYGGYLVHLAVIMIGLAFVGDAYFQQETQGTLSIGEELTIAGYSLRYDDLRQYPAEDGRHVLEATVSLFRDGQFVARLQPRRDFFIVQEQPVTVPGVHSTLGRDVYVILVGWEELSGQSATFKVFVNPLINWAWLGGALMIAGVLVSVWPGRRREQGASYSLAWRTAQARTGGD